MPDQHQHPLNPWEGDPQNPPSAPVSRLRSPDHYLNQIAPSVRDSLTPEQWAEVSRVVNLAIPKPSPKLIDLRFDIDLLISRYYIVLMVGKDRRRSARPQRVSRATRWANWVAAVMLLIGLNLALSAGILLLAYLIKSALGIDFFPGHLRGFGS